MENRSVQTQGRLFQWRVASSLPPPPPPPRRRRRRPRFVAGIPSQTSAIAAKRDGDDAIPRHAPPPTAGTARFRPKQHSSAYRRDLPQAAQGGAPTWGTWGSDTRLFAHSLLFSLSPLSCSLSLSSSAPAAPTAAPGSSSRPRPRRRRRPPRCPPPKAPIPHTNKHNSFIECSIEAGILLSGNGALRTIEVPSAPSG